MMGKLIWLMGPSGSGKDSLLAELRLREQTQLLVAHRYITRDASAGSENHIALSEQEFFTRAGQNLLALSWHANGLYYGVGVEIDLWLHAGFDVLVNGSRAHLPQAVKLVTKNPAQALNLQDRGVIGEGKRADLVLAHRKDNHIHIDHVWRQGKRVF